MLRQSWLELAAFRRRNTTLGRDSLRSYERIKIQVVLHCSGLHLCEVADEEIHKLRDAVAEAKD